MSEESNIEFSTSNIDNIDDHLFLPIPRHTKTEKIF